MMDFSVMQKAKISTAFAAAICSVLLFSPASASKSIDKNAECPFLNAEYIPNPNTVAPHDHNEYSITFELPRDPDPTAHGEEANFVLNIFDHANKTLQTKLRMYYRVTVGGGPPVATLIFSRKRQLFPVFLDKKMREMSVSPQNSNAPYLIILPDARNSFYYDWHGIDRKNLQFLSDKKVIPGSPQGEGLELVPDVWIFNKCREK